MLSYKKYINRKLLVIFFLLLCSMQLFAKGIGTTVFQILQMPTSACDAALANTTVSGEDSALQSPAIIPFVPRSIILTHAIYLEDTKYSVGAVNIPFNDKMGINVSFCYFDLGSMNKTIEYNGGYSEIGEFNANDKVVNVSYGTKLGDKFSAGLSLKYVSQSIDDVSYSQIAGGVSGLYFFSDSTFLNAGINNFGPDVKGYSLPTNLYCGIVGPISDKSTGIIQIDDYYNDDFFDLKAAVETIFGDIFVLRFGYIFYSNDYRGTNDSIITNLTVGAGLKIKGFFVDYSWLPKGDLGNVHMFTVRVNF